MITASRLAKSHGLRTLFEDVTIQLTPGRRVALIGGNGTGKTTLVEILIGVQDADAGEVHIAKDSTVGYLPQELTDNPSARAIDEVLSASALAALAASVHDLEAKLADGDADEGLLDRYGELQSRFEQQGGYALEADAYRVLAGLGFSNEQAQRPVNELSGGWRMRVALARLLFSNPDILMLDEPTNHLDVDSVAWLEQYLSQWSGALLFVSHDRDFIDAVANRIIELANQTATEYVGGFAEFVVAREERIVAAEAAAAQQQRRVAHLELFVDRFRYKATKARQVQSRLKTLQKLEAIPVPSRGEVAKRFAFPEPRRSSRVVAELHGVTGGYETGNPVVSDVELVIERGQKLALVGPNGAGKTTLLKLLLGELTPESGVAKLGNNVDIASFAQHQVEVMDFDKTVLEEFRSDVGDDSGRNLRSILGSFGFRDEASERRVGELSGGEQTRLALAKTMVNPVNLLILDEPTNHLDLPSCDVLEDALVAYPGTVLLVTHDRHLIRSVAERLIVVRDGRATIHTDLDSALAPREQALTPAAARQESTSKSPKNNERKNRRRRSAEQRHGENQARKDLTKAERRWERAEAEVAKLEADLSDPEIYDDHSKVRELSKLHEKAKAQSAARLEEWERLNAADSETTS
ncbi:MAG: ABC-F family ATP-binding cassette domain-containing protein [Acidobacteria bacterium]|nr:ABC-F family ATP-binding cassette domain-containing protein [Acidobacteriota bacterium]